MMCVFFFFQAEDGIRDLVRSRGLGDVYKRQGLSDENRFYYDGSFNLSNFRLYKKALSLPTKDEIKWLQNEEQKYIPHQQFKPCLLYTSDAADERSSVDLGGRRIIKKKNIQKTTRE